MGNHISFHQRRFVELMGRMLVGDGIINNRPTAPKTPRRMMQMEPSKQVINTVEGGADIRRETVDSDKNCLTG